MDLTAQLRAERLLAIVRGNDADAAIRTVVTLAHENVRLIEVSLSSADGYRVIRESRAELGSAALLGAGTVITADEARRAEQAGASFVVTPGVCDGAVEARRLGLPVLIGVLSPTEIASAIQLGAQSVKLFPASVGGPDYLRALAAPFPTIGFVPVGGIDVDAACRYLDEGAIAVGVGSPLIGDAADGGDLDGLSDRARSFLDAVRDRTAS
jgi:2-dehydro-3-deoxyphosphogluconate aldolase/(4S)-4-hydroxy-2-oxoglutarate aldolase